MHVHLLVPDLLRRNLLAPDQKRLAVPADNAAAPAVPSALQLLGRGRHRGAATSLYDWLADRHGLQPVQLTAATSLLGDGGAPGGDTWLRADPVQLTVDRDSLVLADASTFSITADEAAALAQAINAHFAPVLQFDLRTPLHWYARLGDELKSAAALRWTPLHRARGQAVRGNLPQGDNAMRWNALANEVQMLLHSHPVNAAREARGDPLINSLWFWGAGPLATPGSRAFGQVYADDPVARGLTLAAGGSAAPLPPDARAWLQQAANTGQVLFVLDALSPPADYADHEQWLEQAARLERDWFAPLLAALRSERIGMLTLALPGNTTDDDVATHTQGIETEVVSGDLRRFWRRVRPLRRYLMAAKDASHD
ncbi:MAG: hypothetical protein FJY55_06855 [Betaproteobacteria bacterium]|nr:hypothetical protein [Betaproteobacteria bacterium]